MTLTRRERIMIIVGLIVVSIVAYLFYFLIPNLRDTSSAGLQLIQAHSRENQLKYMSEQAKSLEKDIQALDEDMKTSVSSIPVGMDHARILMYLKELTDGEAEELQINISAPAQTQGSFVLQPVVVNFRTDYGGYIRILQALKENKLYSRATYVQAGYAPAASTAPAEPAATVEAEIPVPSPSPTPGASAAPTGSAPATTPTPTATPTPTVTPEVTEAPPVDTKVLQVHLELVFYSLTPDSGSPAAGPLEPMSGERGGSLFPEN